MLVRRIQKPKARTDRWKSQSHLAHVRKHACVACDAEAPIEAAHVRLGSDGGLGRKPSDWFAVPLCRDCHATQHRVGERTFWLRREKDPEAIIAELIRTSPKRREIEEARRG